MASKPKIQDIRDAYLSLPTTKNLLYHEAEKQFYVYNPATSHFTPHESFDKELDNFITRLFGTDISVTNSVIQETKDSLIRDPLSRLTLYKLSDSYAQSRSAFSDQKVLDFKTNTVHPASPSIICFHYFNFPLPTTPTPTPTFDSFILQTFATPDGQEDPQIADFILSILAYYVSPLFPQDPYAFILQGSGSNGKSIFLKILESFIGQQFISSLSMEDLSDRFAPAGLVNKRLNLVSEDQSKFVKVDKIKAMISLEKIKIERKYEEPFFLNPQVKHIFSTNRDIRFDDIDYATMRRIFVIPFPRTFVSTTSPQANDPQVDYIFTLPRTPNLLTNLKNEEPGIFFKVLERITILHDTKFQLAFPASYNQTQKHVQEMSSSALEFFHEYYLYDTKQETLIPTLEIYNQYTTWYKQNEKEPRYMLQSRQFFSILNKNFPGTFTTKKVWSNLQNKTSAARTHMQPIKFPIARIEPYDVHMPPMQEAETQQDSL